MTTGKRGRPKKNFPADPDLPIVKLALALQAAWGLSERKAIDLALALLEGSPCAPSKRPRGSKHKGGTLVGYQLPVRMSFAMSRGVIVRGAVEEYTQRCPGAPAIVFCVDVDHSQRVASAFRERGYRAAHVDGDTPADERRALIAALATTEVQLVANCGLISEGLDVPNVTAAILLRPTKSLALYLQQVGRALRPAPGKERALILDHAGNTYRFGLADAEGRWSLDGRPRGEPGEAPVRRCPECGLRGTDTDFCLLFEHTAFDRSERAALWRRAEQLVERNWAAVCLIAEALHREGRLDRRRILELLQPRRRAA
jgi:hypothetical protein